jgi:hypothetical protein
VLRRLVIAARAIVLTAIYRTSWISVLAAIVIAAGCSGDTGEPPSPNTSPEIDLLARCGSRGAPVTLAKLVRVARANGVTLDIDERGCKQLERIQTSADATNAGPSGLEQRPRVHRREGHVLCTVVRMPHASNREVDVVKYPTDTETQVQVLNVDCAVYPSDAASEQMQVNRLKKALEAIARLT